MKRLDAFNRSLLVAGSLFCFLSQTAWAAAPLIDAADGGAYNAVGRVSGLLQCTGFVVDTEQNDNAPAYVITNAHCIQDYALPSTLSDVAVGESVTDYDFSITLNFFHDSDNQLEIPITEIAYSTMKGTDLAILKLDRDLSELREAGIKPLRLGAIPAGAAAPSINVPGAPMFNGRGQDFLRLDQCQITARSALMEWFWYWRDAFVTDCEAIAEGNSGSPLLLPSGKAVGIINTSTAKATDSETCYLGLPCEVNESGYQFKLDRSYAMPLEPLMACFTRGRFNLDNPGCKLDPGSKIEVATVVRTPTSSKTAELTGNSWDLTLNNVKQGIFYKVGPIGVVDCYDGEGYSNRISPRSPALKQLPLPTAEGVYNLCLRFEELENKRAGQFPIVVPLTVDETGPTQMPFASVLQRGADSLWFDPLFDVPEISGFQYKVIPAAQACDLSDLVLYNRIPISIEIDELPAKVCLLTEDNVANPGKLWEFRLNSVTSTSRYEVKPSEVEI